MARDGSPQRQAAYTRTGVLLTSVIVVIVAVALLAVLREVPARQREAGCTDNLHALGVALAAYAQDNDDHFPLGGDPQDIAQPQIWANSPFAAIARHLRPLPQVMEPYVKNDRVWHCPADIGFELGGLEEKTPFDTRPSSYERFGSSYYCETSMAMEGDRLSTVRFWSPVLPYEEHSPADIVFLYDGSSAWHGGSMFHKNRHVCLFIDGHVQTLGPERFYWTGEYTPIPPPH